MTPPDAHSPAIEARAVQVRCGDTVVLDEVSFSARPGEYIGLVGPNGAGKTTLLKAVAGLVRPSAGEVRLHGVPVPDFRQWWRVGYLPQGFGLPMARFPATVEEIVATGRMGGPRDRAAADAAIEAAMEAAQVAAFRRHRVGALSVGQRQRVLLARTLAGEPDILLLDEPTTALDPVFRDRFNSIVTAWNRQRGATVLLVTHDTAAIGERADRLLYLDRQVVFFGTFDEFCRSDDMTRRFGEFQQHVICHQHGAPPRELGR